MGMFDDHKHNKKDNLTEKAFAQSMAMSIAGIVLSMIALCSVTFAWFSTDVSSSDNVIQAAYCDVSVSVQPQVSDGVFGTPIAVDGSHTFAVGTAYLVTISAEGTASTAYCVLDIGGRRYYTDQMDVGTPLVFTLKLSAGESNQAASADTDPAVAGGTMLGVTVEFLPCWGTYSGYGCDFEHDGSYTVDVLAASPTLIAPETTKTPETTNTPETTAAPETTNAPETTAAPETTTAP